MLFEMGFITEPNNERFAHFCELVGTQVAMRVINAYNLVWMDVARDFLGKTTAGEVLRSLAGDATAPARKEPTKSCPNCALLVPTSTKFCPQCGAIQTPLKAALQATAQPSQSGSSSPDVAAPKKATPKRRVRLVRSPSKAP